MDGSENKKKKIGKKIQRVKKKKKKDTRDKRKRHNTWEKKQEIENGKKMKSHSQKFVLIAKSEQQQLFERFSQPS